MKNTGFVLMALVIGLMMGCAPAGEHTYTQPPLTFTYPSSWRPASKVWPAYTPGEEYKDLGVEEQFRVTSIRKTGQDGAYFVVASAPLEAGQSLEERYHSAYEQFLAEFREVEENTCDLGQYTALEITYERPWGESWWRHRDVWIESEGVVYLFSFYALPGQFDAYKEDFDLIFDSIALEQ